MIQQALETKIVQEACIDPFWMFSMYVHHDGRLYVHHDGSLTKQRKLEGDPENLWMVCFLHIKFHLYTTMNVTKFRT